LIVVSELFLRFVLISLLAFGGGQAALPLVEQVAVQQMRWISAPTFAAAVAFSYVTPGPVLIVAAFIGVQVAGAAGALAATTGAFIAPWMLACLAARQVGRFASHPLLRDYGAGAGPAVVGLLGVTVVEDLTRSAGPSWIFVAIALGLALLALSPRVHPLFLLAAGAGLGWLLGL
jgi:chromate transporter